MLQKDETNGPHGGKEIWDPDKDEIQKHILNYVAIRIFWYLATFWRKALPSCFLRWKNGGDSRFLEIFFIPNYMVPHFWKQ